MIPKENERDLADLPDIVRDGLEIIPVSLIDEVLAVALASLLQKAAGEGADIAATPLASDVGKSEDIVAH